jgi:hypothetical protein
MHGLEVDGLFVSGRGLDTGELVAGASEVWRLRLWVRCLAIAVPLLLASMLLDPQVLNPDWKEGAPADQLPWLAVLWASGEQPPLVRLAHGGGTVVDAELLVEVQEVGLDGGLAHEQPPCRLAVCRPGGHEAQHIDLARAQRR